MKKGKTYYCKTKDGWNLAVKRYRPSTKNQATTPVVLCHGLAVNRYSVDFGTEGTKDWQQYSLAAFLSQGGDEQHLGFDVWVPELRGRGGSKTHDPWEHPNRYTWCVDDYIKKDIPAIISLIQHTYEQEQQRHPQVFWVGKSMGGILAYAHGQTVQGNQDFKGCVIIASPMTFLHSKEYIKLLVRMLPRRVAGPMRIGERLDSDSLLSGLVQDVLAEKENIEPRILRIYVQKGFAAVLSSKVISQFALFVRRNKVSQYPRFPWFYDIFDQLGLLERIAPLRRRFAPYNYTGTLHKFTSPVLVIAGEGDSLAHPDDVKYGYDHVGSKEKTFVLFKKDAEGSLKSSHDYGHLDLNLGRKAKDEVYPVIYQWLVQQNNR